MSRLFISDDQNIGASASASVLAVKIMVDLPWDWLVWSLCCPKDFQESSPAPQFEGINSLVFCLLYGPALPMVHDHHSFDYTDLCQQTAVSVFNTLSRFVIAFLPRSNRLLISWLQSPSAVVLEPKKRKSVTPSTFSPFCLPWSCETGCHDLSFFNIKF